jgi:hypothetical protein
MIRFVLPLIVTCVLLTGCQSNHTYKKMQAKNPLAKNSPKSPTKMVDVWNTYAQTMSDGPPMRGIAGRVHFYSDAKKKQAVKVDGSMTVFVFDGDQKDPAHAKPLKVYQFKPETLSKHYSYKKPLGHGYDFFLPFDSIDGVERPLCVIARFDDTLDGTLVLSPPVNVLLKGSRSEPIKDVMLQASTPPEEIKQVSHTEPSKPEMTRNVSTIALNDHLTRRLVQAPPQTHEPALLPPRTIEQALWTTETKESVVPSSSAFSFSGSDK